MDKVKEFNLIKKNCKFLSVLGRRKYNPFCKHKHNEDFKKRRGKGKNKYSGSYAKNCNIEFCPLLKEKIENER